jgi:serine/threonine protein kinase
VGHLKLVDFGSSLRLGAAEHCQRFVGTAQYVSPEVRVPSHCTYRSATPNPLATPTPRKEIDRNAHHVGTGHVNA